VRPEHVNAGCVPLVGIDPIADGATHATCPRTGRLAMVRTTGPAARPPRNRRRRAD